MFLVFTKKSKFSFYFFLFRGKKLNFFRSHFSLILLGSVSLAGIILGANPETGLKCHFNEWTKRNSRLKKAA